MSLVEMKEWTFRSKYANWNKAEKRRETWSESVDRFCDMFVKKYSDKPDVFPYIEELRTGMKKKKVLGSQRGLQFGGDACLRKNARIYNCVFSYCDRPRFFQEAMYLLMCGSGVGYSVQRHHVDKLPKLTEIVDWFGKKVFVVEDSIEGWANAIGAIINSYIPSECSTFPEYSQREIVFDYSLVSKEGTPLSSCRGKSPGPEPLKKAIENIRTILDKFQGKKLTALACHDIICHFSDAVISGGVRRSALIALFSHDDDEMMSCKTGAWFSENPQRGRANNSAVLLRNKTTFEQFNKLIQNTRQFGEPGFYWTDSLEMGANPCVEISFYSYNSRGMSGWQGCVSGDTPLITKHGMTHIKDSVGKTIEIWNGVEWSKVTPFITGENRELYRVFVSDGSYLDCTSNHKWIVNGTEMTTLDIINSLQHKKLKITRPNISGKAGIHEEYAYEYGFILGDGSVRTNHSASAQLFKNDINLNLRCSKTGPHTDEKHSVEYYRAHFIYNSKKTAIEIKNSYGLPETVFSWDENSILQFLAGWIDADGTKANNGCRLYGQEDKLRYVQILLTSVGINSSINLHSKAGTKTNISTRLKDLWYLQIPNASKIPSRRINLSNGKDPVCKGKTLYVKSVERLDGLHTSYCFEESKLHQGTFGNVLTKQCNLSTINGSKIKTVEAFMEAARLAAIAGTLQAGFTDFPYLGDVSEEIFRREALLGVSITGVMENSDILLNPDTQKRVAEIVKSTNALIADIIGINHAARTTCIKPEGTSSTMLGTSSGIHPHHAKRYIRRIQANKNESLYRYFKEVNPLACEQSVWSANQTDDVISFCIEVPDGSKLKNQTPAIELLEAVKLTQQNWVTAGKNEHLCVMPWLNNNVSNTITVNDNEWDDVTKYIYENRNYFCGISLLSSGGDLDYDQAPFTAVYLPSEMDKMYGDAALFASGLIEKAKELWDDSLWSACNALLGTSSDVKGKAKQEWLAKAKRYADRYLGSDIKKLTYCLKHVDMYKRYIDLKREFKSVDYDSFIEDEDNTHVMQEIACSGNSCELR